MSFFKVLIYFFLNCFISNENLLIGMRNFTADEPIIVSEVIEEGEASFYGEKFQGRRTANTEIYDMNKLTAAHPYLPFNTILEVENIENGKSVLVRINDRGPFIKNRIIDLSVEAARRLELFEKGIGQVRLKVFKKFSGQNIAEKLILKNFILQFGAFSKKENADRFLGRLQSFLANLSFKIIYEDRLFKVVTADQFNEQELKALQEKLKHSRIDYFVRSAQQKEQ